MGRLPISVDGNAIRRTNLVGKEAERFRKKLQLIGLSDPAIEAAWPEWWSAEADPSPSSTLELRFSVARKLGIDPCSLVDEDGVLRFVWKDEARFKHPSGESELEIAAISSFGRAVSSFLLSATSAGEFSIVGTSAADLRSAILRSQQYVRLIDLLSLCWSTGVPVAHLRIFPTLRKRMAAMAIRVGTRCAILLAKDSRYPAQVAFYLAHEVAHIAMGHLDQETAIVDMETAQLPGAEGSDLEELEADQFALELLTGERRPRVLASSGNYNAPGLAKAVLEASSQLQIEPGTIALCFGYSTGNWAVANAAMKFIYSPPKPVWKEVNRVAARELSFDQIPSDAQSYLQIILKGLPR